MDSVTLVQVHSIRIFYTYLKKLLQVRFDLSSASALTKTSLTASIQ